MANDLTALGEFHLDDLQRAPPWGPFQMGLIEEDSLWVDNLVADLNSQQIDLTPARAKAMNEEAPSYNRASSNNTEPRRTSDNAFLDMNDPAVLDDYASLLLFANDPLASHLELKDCDLSKQAIIQSLAAKLDLQYFYDIPSGAIRLQKYRSSFDGPIMPYRGHPSSPSPRSRSRCLTEIQHTGVSTTTQPPPSSLHNGITMDLDSISNGLSFGNFNPRGELDSYYPAASPQYPGLSDDEDFRTAASSSPWGSSWSGLSRTLKEVGACWRCRILRKRCDPDQPCKACPKTGTYNSKWQAVGCKRGTLVDHTPRISLCPKADVPAGNDFNGALDATQKIINAPRDDSIEQCLQDASNRLDGVFASKDDTYTKIVLEILCSPLAIVTDMPLSLRSDVEGSVIHIAWGLIDVASAKHILSPSSVEHTLDVIKAAVTYETEYGLSQAVPIAIECFRSCIEVLRLHDGGYLTSEAHNKCAANKCQVNAVQDLSSNIMSFIDELSKIVFKKDNRLHERRWWLSAFYSLWIQSHVRRIILAMCQSKVQLSADMRRACSDYLLLALNLFDAASACFDPLISSWSLEEEPSNMDLRLMKYYLHAQKALLSDQWARTSSSSMNYLRRLYQDAYSMPITSFQGDPSVSGLGRTETEERGIFSSRPSIFQSNKLSHSEGKFSVPLRTRSGAKRAGSPLQDAGLMRRNGSSSSMLDSRGSRSRGLSIATPASPMSSAYSFAYGTSNSTRWNGSGESLAEMAKLFGTSPPNPREQSNYLSPSTKGRTPSLHYKSSNESFLELPRTINKRRPTRNTSQSGIPGGLFICECCPKKPKKFETIEELREASIIQNIPAHEAERRYQCSYCGNRFKTKNEAERHENSLHVRRHAWSCSNIPSGGYTGIFQESINHLGTADTCGYCGEDFARSGGDGRASESDWAERFNHIREAHKLGECNATKQFYRADRFRQHLKHSHASISGRWTSILETLCMADVPAPKPREEGL
ncbi:hypothetical protein GGR53DRAFT_531425 [Hypoxylon sp. FL1150]|nr:hypothetical protein GGR53DRAFT_531425 [Hypoxylon sp. FL1150]